MANIASKYRKFEHRLGRAGSPSECEKKTGLIPITVTHDAGFMLSVGTGIPMRFDDWLNSEKERIEASGARAEIFTEPGTSLLYLAREPWAQKNNF